MKNEFCCFTWEGKDVLFEINNEIEYIEEKSSSYSHFSFIKLKNGHEILVDQSPFVVLNEMNKSQIKCPHVCESCRERDNKGYIEKYGD